MANIGSIEIEGEHRVFFEIIVIDRFRFDACQAIGDVAVLPLLSMTVSV